MWPLKARLLLIAQVNNCLPLSNFLFNDYFNFFTSVCSPSSALSESSHSHYDHNFSKLINDKFLFVNQFSLNNLKFDFAHQWLSLQNRDYPEQSRWWTLAPLSTLPAAKSLAEIVRRNQIEPNIEIRRVLTQWHWANARVTAIDEPADRPIREETMWLNVILHTLLYTERPRSENCNNKLISGNKLLRRPDNRITIVRPPAANPSARRTSEALTWNFQLGTFNAEAFNVERSTWKLELST